MTLTRTRLLRSLVLVGIGGVLLWVFHEGREEMAKERERERPIKVAPRVSRTAVGEAVLTLDQSTQARLALTVATLAGTTMERSTNESAPPLDGVGRQRAAIQSALATLEAEYEHMNPVHGEASVGALQELQAETITPQPPPHIGDSATGIIIPRTAVVRFGGKTWVYLHTGAETFMRREVTLGRPLQDGWLGASGLTAGDQVVTDGAQTLLSEELKSQIQILEEGGPP